MPNLTLYDAVTKLRESIKNHPSYLADNKLVQSLFIFSGVGDRSHRDERKEFATMLENEQKIVCQSLQIDVVDVDSVPSAPNEFGDRKIYQGVSEATSFYRLLFCKGEYYLFSYNVVFGSKCEPISKLLPELYAEQLRGRNSNEINKNDVTLAVRNYLLSQPETLVDESNLLKIIKDEYQKLPQSSRTKMDVDEFVLTPKTQARSTIPTIPQEQYAVPNSNCEFPITVKRLIKTTIRKKLDDYCSQQMKNGTNLLIRGGGVAIQAASGEDVSANLDKVSEGTAAIIDTRQQHNSQLILDSIGSDLILDQAIDALVYDLLQTHHLFIELLDSKLKLKLAENLAGEISKDICSGDIITNNTKPDAILQNLVSRIKEYINRKSKQIFDYRKLFSENKDFTGVSILILTGQYDEQYYVLDGRPFDKYSEKVFEKHFVVRGKIGSVDPQKFGFKKLKPEEVVNAKLSQLTNSILGQLKSLFPNSKHQEIQNSCSALFKVLKESSLRQSILQSGEHENVCYKEIASILAAPLVTRLSVLVSSKSIEVLFTTSYSKQYAQELEELIKGLQPDKGILDVVHSPRSENSTNNHTHDQMQVSKPDLQNDHAREHQKTKRTRSETTDQSSSPYKRRNILGGDSYGRLYSHSSNGNSSNSANSTSSSSFPYEPGQR